MKKPTRKEIEELGGSCIISAVHNTRRNSDYDGYNDYNRIIIEGEKMTHEDIVQAAEEQAAQWNYEYRYFVKTAFIAGAQWALKQQDNDQA